MISWIVSAPGCPVISVINALESRYTDVGLSGRTTDLPEIVGRIAAIGHVRIQPSQVGQRPCRLGDLLYCSQLDAKRPPGAVACQLAGDHHSPAEHPVDLLHLLGDEPYLDAPTCTFLPYAGAVPVM